MKGRKIFYIAVAVICLISAVFLLKGGEKGENLYAVAEYEGKIIYRENLTHAQDKIINIKDLGGPDVVFEIKNHKIRFLSSDCPDKICVNNGYLSKKDDISVCMPNKIMLYITDK